MCIKRTEGSVGEVDDKCVEESRVATEYEGGARLVGVSRINL